MQLVPYFICDDSIPAQTYLEQKETNQYSEYSDSLLEVNIFLVVLECSLLTVHECGTE